jgi:hypothetical protein
MHWAIQAPTSGRSIVLSGVNDIPASGLMNLMGCGGMVI